MGIRKTQPMGLSERGRQIVEGKEVLLYRVEGRRIYPDGRVEEFREDVRGSDVASEKCGSYEGMFGEAYPLRRYRLPDGRVFEEAIQEEIWSSGPCIFLALKDADGEWVEESLWTEEEISTVAG